MKHLLHIAAMVFALAFWQCSENDPIMPGDADTPEDGREVFQHSDFEWLADEWSSIELLREEPDSVEVKIEYGSGQKDWLVVDVYTNSKNEKSVFVCPKNKNIGDYRTADVSVYTSTKIHKIHFSQTQINETDNVWGFLDGIRQDLVAQGICEKDSVSLDMLRKVRILGRCNNWPDVHIYDCRILSWFPSLKYLHAFIENNDTIDFRYLPEIDTCLVFGQGRSGNRFLNLKNIDKASKLSYFFSGNLNNSYLDLSSNEKLKYVDIYDGSIKSINLPESVEKIHLSSLSIESLHIPFSVDSIALHDLPIKELPFSPNSRLKRFEVLNLDSLRSLDFRNTNLGLNRVNTDLFEHYEYTPVYLHNVGVPSHDFLVYLNDMQLDSYQEGALRIYLTGDENHASKVRVTVNGERPPSFELKTTCEADRLSVFVNVNDEGNPPITHCYVGYGETQDVKQWKGTFNRRGSFYNLIPGKTYYVQGKVESKNKQEYLSPIYSVTLKERVEPKMHIGEITTTHSNANIEYYIDDAGYPNEGRTWLYIGESADLNDNDDAIDYISGFYSISGSHTCNFNNLKPDTWYYARLKREWYAPYIDDSGAKGDMKYVYSDVVKFKTQPSPPTPANVSFSCSYGTNQTVKTTSGIRFNVWVKLKGSVTGYEPGDKFYFDQPSYLGKLTPEEGTFNYTNTSLTFYYYSNPYTAPELDIRAVLEKADGRVYYSNWSTMSFGL